MAETKKTKKTEAKADEVKEVKKKSFDSEWKNMSTSQLKVEMQKLSLDMKTGKEKNTSIMKRLKKHIARELTKSNKQVEVKE